MQDYRTGPDQHTTRAQGAAILLGLVVVLGRAPATRARAESDQAAVSSDAGTHGATVTTSTLTTKPPRYELIDGVNLEMPGNYRFRVTSRSEMLLSEIPVGARASDQVRSESQTYSEHRLRLDPVATLYDQASVHVQMEVLTGMLSGDTSGREYMYFAQPPQRWNSIDGGDLDDFVPVHLRHAYGQWESPVGRLQVGRMGSDWGLRLLASAGDGDHVDFGDAYYGDIVDRVLFATKPVSILRRLFGSDTSAATGAPADDDPVVLAFAYDWNVVRDNLIRRAEDKQDLRRASTPESAIELQGAAENDDAQECIGALRVKTASFEGGFYAVRREQQHFDVLIPAANRPGEEFLRVWVFDSYGKLAVEPEFLDGGALFGEAEVAFITGDTNLSVSAVAQSPRDPFPVSAVEQLGFLARGGVRFERFDAVIEGGYASGDGDPFDGEVRDFRFHPDLNVGLILFEDLLAGSSAASARNATLVFNESGPVRTLGADLLPTNGAVTNAIFVAPRVRVRPWSTLEAVLSVLWARTDADFVDPSTDFIEGGAFGVFNSYGAPASNHGLGWELDLALRYTFEQVWADVEVGLQFGHLFPGNVFENVDGERMDDVDKVQGRLTFSF